MSINRYSILAFLCVTTTWLQLPAQAKKFEAPHAIPGAINHLEVYYVDGVRLVGDDGFRKDHQLAIDVHIPKSKDSDKRYPCIITVHGGGFGGGDKNVPRSNLHKGGVKAGFVMVDANYILSSKTLHPQVIYDIRDLVRYLRIHAKRFRIDPDAIGLAGYSAGGWLISGAWFPNGDYLGNELSRAITYTKYAEDKKRNRLKIDKKEFRGKRNLAQSKCFHFMRNPTPHYPGVSASVQALSYDFSWYHEIFPLVREMPAINWWCGLGKDGKPRKQPGFNAEKDYFASFSQITPERYFGQGVHCPRGTTEAMSYDNKSKIQFYQRKLEFFKKVLVTDRRVPNPEIQPGMRIIDAPTEVQILTTSPGIVVHYTTDGSKPSTGSTRYAGPFTVKPGTTVKALAVRGNERASQVVKATFYEGKPPPQVIAPDVEELPQATAGKPYKVTFKASDPAASYWFLGGELCNTKDGIGVNGLTMSKDGVLSGTPKHGGRFWLQVQVAHERLGVATLRNYRLVIAGPKGEVTQPFSAEDRNVDFATAPASYTRADIDTILKPITNSGIEVHINKTNDGWTMVIDKMAWKTAQGMIFWGIQKGEIKRITFAEKPGNFK